MKMEDECILSFYKEFTQMKIKELLKIISLNYPTKFSNDKISLELDIIYKHITFDNHKKIRKNKKKINYKVDESQQCFARSWDYIYNKLDNTPVFKLPNKFKCNDLEKFKLKEFNDLYILGKRCKSKKNSNKYCKLHQTHLIHGNYYELPNSELCYHFIKDNKILFY